MHISVSTKGLLKFLGLILFYATLSAIMAVTLNSKGIIWGGDDAPFHVGRLISLNYSFEHGNLIPSISNSNFRQIGYGINLFYPWITIAPIALLFSLFSNPITAFYTGIGIYFFISFFISHIVMVKFSKSFWNAIIFSLFYNLSNYLLIEVLPRTDIAEFIATILLPICFLGLYEVFFRDFHKWNILAIGMSGLLLTHLLSTVIVSSFFIIILLLYVIKSNNYWNRIKALCKAIFATICASAIFLIPFLNEITFQPYEQPSPYILKGKVLEKIVSASFLNSSIQSTSGNTYNIGVFLIVALIFGLIFFYKFSTLYKRIYVLAFLSFFMTTNVFPWSLFQNTPIRVIQFPFRFLMVATLLASVIAAKLLIMLIDDFNLSKLQFPITIILAAILCGFWISSVHITQQQKMISKKTQIITSKKIKKRTVYEDYYEQYSPAAAGKFINSTIWHIGKIDKQKITFDPQAKGESTVFKLGEMPKNTVVELPVIRYKNTELTINGKHAKISTSKNGTVRTKFNQKIKHPKLKVTYKLTNLTIFSAALSFVSWVFLLLGLNNENKYNWKHMEKSLKNIKYNNSAV
ncbi:hypothetical protein [Companilactobacillus nodensis]|uniref:Membrane protein 6-pyruvoyl-tetrahydropterin synthase-related domain-containing protein n=1 Tax=Companilactobacillus nodensis DSM 19682 = JCM 14932 = NBRC 107160 TaxID=1423775 RepID=A0A0R1K6C3_9LACO|nr:hypothetical protein [Companilactobacillus nodensis]KRK79183.1 hypothetical protein FD03_GL001548 [Companilactobacillus nodensis DSM 19682 = JCM 14932 = NBRC 107160]